MQHDDPTTSPTLRRVMVAGAGLGLVLFGSFWLLGDRSGVEPTSDEVEVCQATEYEGCPQRWEYLWADED